MLQVLHMGIHASQLMGYGQINQSMDLITTNSAKTMHIADRYGIEVGKPANLIVLKAQNEFDAIRKQAEVTHSIRNGTLLEETKPKEKTVKLGYTFFIYFES